MPRPRFRTSVHSFASTSRKVQPNFRRKSSLSASVQPDTSDDGELESTMEPNEDSTECSDVYMSLHVSHESVGCAVYEVESGRVSLLEDCLLKRVSTNLPFSRNGVQDEVSSESGLVENPVHASHCADTITSVIYRFQPDLVLASNNCPKTVLTNLKKELSNQNAVLQIRASKEFNKDRGMAVLLDLRTSISSNGIQQSPHLALTAMPLSVSAAHALLSHLQRHASLNQADNEVDGERQEGLSVTGIELISLSETMYISVDTRKTLNIFDEQDHAIMHAAKGKEGLSICSLFNVVQTTMSRALLRHWLLFPSLSLDVLNARLDAVALFLERKTLVEQLRKEVRGTQNIHRFSARLVDGKADLSTWRGIYDFVIKCLVVRGHCSSLDEDSREVGIINAVLFTFSAKELQQVCKSIRDMIDWDESCLNQRVCVKAGVDAQLDEWRQIYANLPSILNSIASRVSTMLGDLLDNTYDMYIEYFPQVGYLQALCRKDGREIDDECVRVGEGLDWIYQYCSEVKAYFKTDETKDLDGQLGDLYSFIAGREIELVQSLYDKVQRYLTWLTSCSDVMAEMDCLLAFAVVAAKNGYVRPVVTDDTVLDIRDGRHPLQELIVETFVPNDTTIEGGKGVGVDEVDEESFNSVVIVTGANACGKSIYLKQCALIVFMAQIGSFVPAKSATIGIVDKIFTRMQASESASTMQSSFLLDMQQVNQALQSSTRRSLVLLDEMGKGTSSTDGASLFAATIRYLLERGNSCPRILAATHFHEVFHEDFLSESLPYTPAHMQVLLGRGQSSKLDESITFLYKLRYGLELTSHATQCELLCGMPRDVVERAAYIAQLSRNHNLHELQLEIQDSLQDSTENESRGINLDLQKAEDIARAFVEWNIGEDEEAAAMYGEHPALDPQAKLVSILQGSSK